MTWSRREVWRHAMAVLLCVAAVSSTYAGAQVSEPRYRVLVFSKTAGFRHAAIPAGISALRALGEEKNFAVELSEDAAIFNPRDLERFAAVVFLNTTGDILNEDQQRAFEAYIAGGNGFVGIHSAADTEYDWPWYGGLVGAYFAGHPRPQRAVIRVVDREFPGAESLPSLWPRLDEWYNYRENPRSRVRVLMTLDEQSYQGGTMGGDHPIAWAHEYGGGRAFYTGLGHTREAYAESLFRQHLIGGLEWAAGQVRAQTPP